MAALFLLFLAAGGRDWEIGVIGTGLVIIVMSPVLNYVMAVRRIAKHFKRRSSVSGNADADYADYGFSEDGVSATSMLGTALVPWTRITRLRRFHRIWLMYMGSHCLGVFPTHLLPTEVKDLLVAQIRAHGGRLA